MLQIFALFCIGVVAFSLQCYKNYASKVDADIYLIWTGVAALPLHEVKKLQIFALFRQTKRKRFIA